MEAVLGLLAVGGLAYLLVRFARPGYNLLIVVRDSRVEVSGKAARGKHGEIGEFFRQDLPHLRKARVEGSWDGRTLRLRISGAVPPGLRQRIRNFLNATL